MDNYGYVPEEANGRVHNNNNNNNGRPFTISRHNGQVAPNDYLVFSGNKQKPATYYKRLSIVLFIISVIFLIGLITFLVLYLVLESKPKICTSDECLRSASNLKYSIDFTKDPCDNFYEYCCGKWSKEHINHGWFASFSTFSTITEKILIESNEVLVSQPRQGEPEAINMARKLYQSCMDQEALDRLGLKVVVKYLNMTDLPLVPSMFTFTDDKSTFKFDWLKTEAYIKQLFAMDVFFGFAVQANYFNRSENVIFLGSPYQQCPLPTPLNKDGRILSRSKDFPSENDEDEEKRESLRKVIRGKIFKFAVQQFVKYTGRVMPDEAILQESVEIINNMTDYFDELSENSTLPEGVPDQEEEQAYNISHLQYITDKFLPTPIPDLWTTYMNYIFVNTNVTFEPQSDLIYIIKSEEMYLMKMVKFLSKTPQIHLELYMWWVTVHAMIINTSSDIVDYINKVTAVFYEETREEKNTIFIRSRSLECSDMVTNYMGWAVSYAIVDKSFTNNTKPKVQNMINDIKQAFMEHVKKITWLDSETKTATLDKNKEMLSFIGYPDWLFEEGALDEYYKGLEIKEDEYLSNMMSMIIQYENKSLTSLRLENKRDWSTEPINVNAYNSFLDNAINIPIGILNFPMYNLGLEVLNYGSIGTILGHELTHGFDNTVVNKIQNASHFDAAHFHIDLEKKTNQEVDVLKRNMKVTFQLNILGRRHDKYGNFVQWWSNKTIMTFENLTDCFVKQYENFTLENVEGHVKGKATLGENIADNGGLNQAVTAYKKYLEKYGKEPKLPGFENYTSFQLFFIAYGSLWCETINTDELKDQLEYDEHSPNSIRVIGTLQNSDDFSDAFHCPRGSFMNPNRDKCKIW